MQSLSLKESAHPPQNCFPGCFLAPSKPPPATETTTRTTTSTATLRRDFAETTSSTIFPKANFTNPKFLPSLKDSFTDFTKAYPKYSLTYKIDQIRSDEYFHLSFSNYTCLDYIGIGLFSYSQLLTYDPSTYQISSALSESPFFSISRKTGNLKETLLCGRQELEFESAMKKRVMDFLNISENDYSMVFTVNRTSAFRLLTESYPFQSNRKVLTVYDYESDAVDEMAKISEKRGGKVTAAEFSWPRLRIHSSKLRKTVTAGKKSRKKGIFVFPLHSRVTGARYPYQWMSVAQENGWHVLIDACGLGPKDMGSFALSIYRPDFMVCSFYKVFGENPSGFGCLFVKKSTISVLEASACSGMVNLVPADKPMNFGATELNQTMEGSGHSEPVECRGLDHVDSLGLTMTSNRTRCLINWLVSALLKLHHSNKQGNSNSPPLVKIYGPKIKFDRGPALAFNLLDSKGEKFEPLMVQKLAEHRCISLGYAFLKSICFKEKYQEVKERVLEKKQDKDELGVAVLTVALGFLANFEDVYRLWIFVASFLDSDFVEKERGRYAVLDHHSTEIL